MTGTPSQLLSKLDGLLPDLESALSYKDIHAHPELSMQEHRTSQPAADHVRAAGYEVAVGIGNTGVVGLLRNGDGLPGNEATGLPYASNVTATDHEGKTVPVMHACGHDMHLAWLREAWHGTLMPVFQPAEETGEGARAMIDDGLFKRFPRPDAILAQHVMVGPSGLPSSRSGAVTSTNVPEEFLYIACWSEM